MSLQCLENHRESQVILVDGENQTHYVSVPKKYRSQLFDTLVSNRLKGIYLAQTLYLTQRSLIGVSSELSGFFGVAIDKVNSVTGELMEAERLEDLDELEVERRAKSIAAGLYERYGSAAFFRRQELGEDIFTDPVMVEVCAMHWREFIRHGKAKLINSRACPSTGTPESLFKFKDRMFLVGVCGTGKVVILPVGEKVKSCEQAQAWLAGDTVKGLPLPKFIAKGRT